MDQITSRSNAKIKSARALRQRKYRDETGSFLVEGIHHVGAAVEANAHLEAIFYAPDVLQSQFANELVEGASIKGTPCYPTTAEVFASLSGKENPQGIIAILRQPKGKLIDLKPPNFSWGVACISPQDPGNVGAILRTIDAVGADGLILIDGGVDAYHPTAVRASMGALFRHPVVTTIFSEFVLWGTDYGYHIYGSSARGDLDYQQVTDFARPAILLLGSERQGLTKEQANICEQLIRLPMKGDVTSLNLAVAAGVLLYGMLEKIEGNA
jgi:TrmH family RNA methyltransferase